MLKIDKGPVWSMSRRGILGGPSSYESKYDVAKQQLTLYAVSRLNRGFHAKDREDMKSTSPKTSGYRIGIMLRGIDEIDGPGVYIRGLCSALFDIDKENEYFLYYIKEDQKGIYSGQKNVTERVLPSMSKLDWDQISVPIHALRDDLDVIFHHKFSIPLLSHCPTVVQLRGAEHWIFPEWYEVLERYYAKFAYPIFCKKADQVLSNSKSLSKQMSPYIGVPVEEIEYIYAAPNPQFSPVTSSSRISDVRSKYNIPDCPFYLMVAKGYSSVRNQEVEMYPRKNVQGVVEAYGRLQRSTPREDTPPLVVAGPGFNGEEVRRLRKSLPYGDLLQFPGYVDFEDMPTIYSIALALVFPSYSESFGIPLVEAMACGCPVITSKTTACPEVVGEAGLLIDPYSVDEIYDVLRRIKKDDELKLRMQRKSIKRSNKFTWDKNANKLLSILEESAKK